MGKLLSLIHIFLAAEGDEQLLKERQFSGSCPVSRQNRSYSRRWFCSRI